MLKKRLRQVGYEAGRSLLSPGDGESAEGDGLLGAAAVDPAFVEAERIEPENGEMAGGAGGGAAAAGLAGKAGAPTSLDTTNVRATPPQRRRVVRYGSRGQEVAYAQERLNVHGTAPELVVDGIFGPLTRKATRDYQGSHALATDAVIGPRTWASLDGPPHVGTSAGQASGGGAGGPGSTMLYDATPYTYPPPPPGTKRDAPIAEINQKQKANPPDLGPTIKVEGAPPGSDGEVHLYWAIARLGTRSRWGSEVDMVQQVGFPPKGGGTAPMGKITLRMDGQGNATASLLGSGAATVAATYASKTDAIKGLKSSFGFADVVDGDANWTLDELNKVQAALGRLSGGEAAALKGVVLKRVHSAEEDGKPAAGVFKTDHGLSADNKTATSEATLILADSAFSADLQNFIGSASDAAPISFLTILHEVGHAVEEAERYKARKAEYEATAEVNRKVEVFNADVASANSALAEVNTAWAAAVQAIRGYKGAQAQQADKYVRAVDAVNPTLGALTRNRNVGQRSKVEGDAQKAIATRDAEKAALAKASPGHAALTDLDDVSSKQDASLGAGQRLAKSHAEWEASRSAKSAATTARAATEDHGKTKRLKRFEDFVAKEKIPPLTAYAKTGTSEFYAEAFSLWLADPDYLKLVAPRLHAWFAAGEHLK